MQKIKKPILLITYGLILFFILLNFNIVTGFWGHFISLVTPFIGGFALAYLLNIPYSYILTRLFKATPEDKHFARKKTLSIVLAYALFLCVIIFSFLLLIPQLLGSVNEFINNLSGYYTSFEALTSNLIENLTLQTFYWEDIQSALLSYKNQFLQLFNQLINNVLPSLINVATGTASGVFNLVLTLILSVYFLGSKEKLIALVRASVDALASTKTTQILERILATSNDTFKGFILGQLTDALIVGIITFICSSVFGFPYPMLIGFIAGITNIIPVIGPIIGAVPCVFIILMAAPEKVLWYLIFVVVLQQVDGNFICPKIVGDSIGLDGIWVIFAVIVGGGLFGIVGSFLCVPVFAILFKLYNEWIAGKLSRKCETPQVSDSN